MSDHQRTTLENELALLRNRMDTLQGTLEAHMAVAEQARLCLVESRNKVNYWRTRSGQQDALIDEMKSEIENLKAANEKLRKNESQEPR
ncbi:hypothetical protein AAVH_23856 [Aphelenchoides avenae]|nr:hypothetical protein AAVH_23856 [Aphelenchus avenae]